MMTYLRRKIAYVALLAFAGLAAAPLDSPSADAADEPAPAPATAAKTADDAKPAATKSAGAKPNDPKAAGETKRGTEPKNVGGEPDGVVQVANVVYAGFKSSKCFSDHFLVDAEKDAVISTSRRFHAVKLASDEVYGFPLIIMTGEGAFQLPDAERKNLRQFIERGGFLLASAGCSSEEWDRSFRREMALVFPDRSLAALGMEHPVFHTVHDINQLEAKHGTPKPLEGISFNGRLGVIYSQDGLNDTANTQGCCCCGGNEIYGAAKVNVNILVYAVTH